MNIRQAALFLVCLVSFENVAFSQSALDKQNFIRVNNALKVWQCEDAAKYLAFISDDGKKSAEYMLAMAGTAECRSDTKQALVWYEQYAVLNPSNDTVQKKITALKNGTVAPHKPSGDEQRARELYKNAKKGSTFKRKKIIGGDTYYMRSGSYGLFTDKVNSPYPRVYMLDNTFNYPKINKHAVFATIAELGYATGANRPWFADLLDAPLSNVEQVGNGIVLGLGMSFSGVAVNRQKFALTAGPVIGLRAVVTASSALTGNDSIDPLMFQLYAGVKAEALIGRGLSISVAYQKGARTKETNNQSYPEPTSAPMNTNMIRFGIGYFTYW
jgi:hypothetical protein